MSRWTQPSTAGPTTTPPIISNTTAGTLTAGRRPRTSGIATATVAINRRLSNSITDPTTRIRAGDLLRSKTPSCCAHAEHFITPPSRAQVANIGLPEIQGREGPRQRPAPDYGRPAVTPPSAARTWGGAVAMLEGRGAVESRVITNLSGRPLTSSQSGSIRILPAADRRNCI